MVKLYSTPRFITSEIESLCRELDATQQPVFVSVCPEPDCLLGDCYGNVERKVAACSGRPQHGWNIKVWPNILLDAQFHAVYVAPSGTYLDITPPQDKQERILFLADTARAFSGERILNIRVPLADDDDIRTYITLTAQKDELYTRYHQAGLIRLSAVDSTVRNDLLQRRAELVRRLAVRYTSRNAPCPCGKDRTFKRCCLPQWGRL